MTRRGGKAILLPTLPQMWPLGDRLSSPHALPPAPRSTACPQARLTCGPAHLGLMLHCSPCGAWHLLFLFCVGTCPHQASQRLSHVCLFGTLHRPLCLATCSARTLGCWVMGAGEGCPEVLG